MRGLDVGVYGAVNWDKVLLVLLFRSDCIGGSSARWAIAEANTQVVGLSVVIAFYYSVLLPAKYIRWLEHTKVSRSMNDTEHSRLFQW